MRRPAEPAPADPDPPGLRRHTMNSASEPRTHGRTNSTTIKSLVPDGSRVERGQLLVEFDDSALQDEWQAVQGPLALAKADWILAEKNLDILRSQNETDVKTAEVNLELAE